MKCEIKFHCKQPRQTRIDCSQEIQIPHEWHCSVDFEALSFSFFMWKLAMWHLLLWRSVLYTVTGFLWIFSLLSVLVHLLKALFQETSLVSSVRWMSSHSNFIVVHVEKPRFFSTSTWSHMMMYLKYLNHFSNTTRFSHSI